MGSNGVEYQLSGVSPATSKADEVAVKKWTTRKKEQIYGRESTREGVDGAAVPQLAAEMSQCRLPAGDMCIMLHCKVSVSSNVP